MNNISYKVALGGVVSSLCILAMFLTGVMPFLNITLPMIAGALMTIIVVEVNVPWAFLTYIAVSILSVFVTFDKEAALIFILLFGHYPIIKLKLDSVGVKPLQIFLKLLIFNVCAVCFFQLTIHLLGVTDYQEEFSKAGKYGIYIFWALSNVFFFFYDYALGGCIEMYNRYLKPKIFGRRGKRK